MKKWLALVVVGIVGGGLTWNLWSPRMGRQPDGSYYVSTGQQIPAPTISFNGRPIDLALHPRGGFFAIMKKGAVFLANEQGEIKDSEVKLGVGAGFRGLAWSPNGEKLYASTAGGYVQAFDLQGEKLVLAAKIELKPGLGEVPFVPAPSDNRIPAMSRPNVDPKLNPVPGGLCITKDGTRMYVALAERNAVAEINVAENMRVREIPVEMLPFECRLSEDESTLIVSNWGGRIPTAKDRKMPSHKAEIVGSINGSAATGSVTLVGLRTGKTKNLATGLHPCAIAVQGGRAYIANALSDSISVIDIEKERVERTIKLQWNNQRLLGSLPNALAVRGDRLYVANGGDNSLAEVDLKTNRVLGFRAAGYFPCAVTLTADGTRAIVLNNKGAGSVANTIQGKQGNAHDFLGTVSLIPLNQDLDAETARVAANNHWPENAAKFNPDLGVYKGKIKHVLFIIKENRTYDEVFGDLPEGNGDPKLCSIGGTIMPNHRKIAQQFTLFDNGYVAGTNSAEGHNWTTQAIANDYLERFYVGYSRTYPDDGSDGMALSTSGALWDLALRHGKTIRVYGEFTNPAKNSFDPKPKDWFEIWEDRKSGKLRKMQAVTDVPSLKPHINPVYHYWPLFQSDQMRADEFIREYSEFSKKDKVPDLMIMSLPCDHTEGISQTYPTPRAMMADNDLALGRVVEAVSSSPQWKDTCIFVIEDDAQAGPDHVDGHRTVFMAISPYTKRKHVDSTMYTTLHMLRSIEMMLGLPPMTKFDAFSYPLNACFQETPDLSAYTAVPNNIPLDERNPVKSAMTQEELYWAEKSESLDWSLMDRADPYWLNRIVWFSLHKGKVPYPGRPGEAPGQIEDDDD